MNFEASLEDDIGTTEVIELYKASGWSSAEKPEKLMPALKNSDALVTARISGKLVGIEKADEYEKFMISRAAPDYGSFDILKPTESVLRLHRIILEQVVQFYNRWLQLMEIFI